MLLSPPVKKKSLAELIADKKLAALKQVELMREMQEDLKEEAIVNAPAVELIAAPSEVDNPTTPKNPVVIKKLSIKELIAARKEAEAPRDITTIEENLKSFDILEVVTEDKETFALDITLNDKQLMAKDLAFAGKNFCLVGAAGTGKTTAQREVARALLESDSLETHTFRVQGTGERVAAPSIAFVAYTRVASGNLRRAIHKVPALAEALKYNITTIHNLLEYTPETYWDDVLNKECFQFKPLRNAAKPLDITHLIIEEASMVDLKLWGELYAAILPGTQIIFIGDINQLPPVFGDSVLNYALVQLPVVELTEVYRQAGDSNILANAHRILKGEMIQEAKDFKVVTCGTVNHTQIKLSMSLGMTFPKWMEAGAYDPMSDIILSPWNKRDLGTENMNKWIAQMLGAKRKATVYEVIAGRNKLYLAEGDKIMYNKQVGVIDKININGSYIGKPPMPHSTGLTRFGLYIGGDESSIEQMEEDYSSLNLDAMMDDVEDRTKEASHSIHITLDDGGTEILNSCGALSVANFTLAYALTVHKAQGCEWRKVYFIMHRDHAVSLCRELLYTAVTRAREECVLIAKWDVIERAIAVQKIKGNTTADKIAYFNNGTKINNAVYTSKDY